MTKWKRLRKRREREKAEAGALNPAAEVEETKPTEPTKTSRKFENQQKIEEVELSKTSKPKTILTQIPRYAYLVAFFAFASGIFYPLITPDASLELVIGGIAALCLGLVGGILLFKAAKSEKKQGIFITTGLALIAISLVLIYWLEDLTTAVKVTM